MPDAARDAGEDRRVARECRRSTRCGRSSCTRSRKSPGSSAFERDHELLVVEAERVGRVDADLRVAPSDLDVLSHDPHALLGRAAGTTLASSRTDTRTGTCAYRAQPRVAPPPSTRTPSSSPGRSTASRPSAIRPLWPSTTWNSWMSVRPGAERPQHQVRVSARADQRVRAQEAVGGEVVAGCRELLFVPLALAGGQPPPGRIDLQERELDEIAVHLRKVIVAPRCLDRCRGASALAPPRARVASAAVSPSRSGATPPGARPDAAARRARACCPAPPRDQGQAVPRADRVDPRDHRVRLRLVDPGRIHAGAGTARHRAPARAPTTASMTATCRADRARARRGEGGRISAWPQIAERARHPARRHRAGSARAGGRATRACASGMPASTAAATARRSWPPTGRVGSTRVVARVSARASDRARVSRCGASRRFMVVRLPDGACRPRRGRSGCSPRAGPRTS